MINTSKDILFVVLAFCALWLTLFVSWTIYYFAQILRQANVIISDFRNSLNLLDSLLKTIKEKLNSSSSHLAFMAEGAREVVKYLQNKKIRSSRSNKK